MSVMHEKESIWFSSTMDLVEHWVNVVEQSLSSKSGGHHCFFFFFLFFLSFTRFQTALLDQCAWSSAEE